MKKVVTLRMKIIFEYSINILLIYPINILLIYCEITNRFFDKFSINTAIYFM